MFFFTNPVVGGIFNNICVPWLGLAARSLLERVDVR